MRSGHQASGNAHSDHGSTKMSRPYGMLALNLAISLAIMYFVMFAMINSLGEFIQNLNFLYMALMMWAPMGTLMLVMMGGMYRNKRLNLVLHGLFALIFVLSFIGIREQSLVGDRQFVRSMIPHHSGAILMCREAQISDPEIKDLCETDIIPSQRKEVEQMKAILARL
jgi:predicted membrane protein